MDPVSQEENLSVVMELLIRADTRGSYFVSLVVDNVTLLVNISRKVKPKEQF